MSSDSRIRKNATRKRPDSALAPDPALAPDSALAPATDPALAFAPGQEAGTRHGGRTLFVAWLALMALTVGSYALSDPARAPGASATSWLLSFAVFKSHLIAGIYMEMWHGPRVWLVLMSSFLIAEATLISIVLP